MTTRRANQTAPEILADLRQNGIVIIEDFVPPELLSGMRSSFETAVDRMRHNEVRIGYYNTDNYRRMVDDVLILDRGFMRCALDPRLLDVMDEYLGPQYQLTEAKGWRSLPTEDDFHGWHNDAWYAMPVTPIPRQLKLAIYLSDVTTGYFSYLAGSHGDVSHRHWSNEEVQSAQPTRVDAVGKAGTALLFDVSGMHRQSAPIRQQRDAVFLVYNDPKIAVQNEDIRADRYHPLLLNAAHLTDLDERSQRVLGFGSDALSGTVPRGPSWPRFSRYLEAAQSGVVWQAQRREFAMAALKKIRRRFSNGNG